MHLRSFLPILVLTTTSAAAAAHPILYLTPQRILDLRNEIQSTRADHWNQLRQQAESLARSHPPALRPNDTSDQIWQRDVGNALPTLAMAWLLTSDPKYQASTEEWALASCHYPTWGFGIYLNNDLPAGHQLFGLALVYDWMFADLSPSTRDIIHSTLLNRGRSMYNAADPKTGVYWKTNYLQNHLWVNMAGLAAAALAMPEEPETASWLDRARALFRITESSLGPDGASHEGVGYWSYGVEYMLKFWALSADLLGEDISNQWWANTSMYRLYMSLPRASWAKTNTVIDLADCTRDDCYGPDYQLFNLAHRFQDPYAQWLGLEMESAHRTTPVSPFLNLLWFDPAQPAQSPQDLPTLRYFDDMGIVSARSDWSGKESLVVFKSGPPAGNNEVQIGFPSDPGFGHVHPDANHLMIFGNGQWILQDDGYAWKETGQHNTLLVDGAGQIGEHNQWFGRRPPLPLLGEPAILQADSTPDFDLIAGDATGAYASTTGVRKFVRHVIFWKPSAVIVLDDIETDRPRNLELRFHPLKDAAAGIDLLTPEHVLRNDADIAGKDRDGNPFPQWTVCLTRNTNQWRNVVAITWPAASITMTGDPEVSPSFNLAVAN